MFVCSLAANRSLSISLAHLLHWFHQQHLFLSLYIYIYIYQVDVTASLFSCCCCCCCFFFLRLLDGPPLLSPCIFRAVVHVVVTIFFFFFNVCVRVCVCVCVCGALYVNLVHQLLRFFLHHQLGYFFFFFVTVAYTLFPLLTLFFFKGVLKCVIMLAYPATTDHA